MSKRSNAKKRRKKLRMFEAQRGLCWLCGGLMRLDVDLATHPDAATFDHVIPRAHNGTGRQNNLLLAHKRCNAARGGRLVQDEIRRAERALTPAVNRATNRAPLQHEPETHRRAYIVSKINLSIEADDAADLFQSIRALAGLTPDSTLRDVADAAHGAGKQAAVTVESDKPARTRKAKATETPEAPVDPLTVAAQTVAAAEKVAERIAAVSAETEKPAPTPEPAADEGEAVGEVTKAQVQQAMVAIVQKHGRDVCGAFIKSFGAANLTALDESKYLAAYTTAKRVLELSKDAAKAEFGVAA